MNSINLDKPASKVDFRRYLTNRREPLEISTGYSETALDAQAGIIKDAHPQKQIFRQIARRIRAVRLA